MAYWLPLFLSFTPSSVFAAESSVPTTELTYAIRVAGAQVGTRRTTVRYEDVSGQSSRTIESYTDIDATIGPVHVVYKQRLTGFASSSPASFHSVIEENGSPIEIQARWGHDAWTVTVVDRRASRTVDHPTLDIDLSTVDLIDPGTRFSMSRMSSAKVLSAETGDIWEGEISPLGSRDLSLGGREVTVDGFVWMSPEGRSEFWYDGEGYLVQYNMRLLGFRVEGTLTEAPPPGPDEFAVGLGSGKVDVSPL